MANITMAQARKAVRDLERARAAMDFEDWERVDHGIGSLYDLRDAPQPRPRLLGLKSVSPAAAWALHKSPKVEPRQPFGFRRK